MVVVTGVMGVVAAEEEVVKYRAAGVTVEVVVSVATGTKVVGDMAVEETDLAVVEDTVRVGAGVVTMVVVVTREGVGVATKEGEVVETIKTEVVTRTVGVIVKVGDINRDMIKVIAKVATRTVMVEEGVGVGGVVGVGEEAEEGEGVDENSEQCLRNILLRRQSVFLY